MNFTPIPGWESWENQGAGIATADLDGSGRPDLLVLRVDAPDGANRGFYRVGRDLDAGGNPAGGWTGWLEVPGWESWENQGAGITVADLDSSGQPDLFVLRVDAPAGANRGLYRVGRNLDAAGTPTGGWTGWLEVPGWESWENQGAGIAVADLDGNGRPDLLVLRVDAPDGANRGFYRVGRNLDADGNPTGGWTGWMPVDWFSWENQGAGIEVADLDGDGRPELIVFQVDNPPQLNGAYYQVGWGLDDDGQVVDGWSPWVQLPDWRSWDNQGASITLANLAGGGRPDLLVLGVDAPPGLNQGEYGVTQLEVDLDQAAAKGIWRLLPFQSPLLAVHAALLHTGKVFFFAGSSNNPDNLRDHLFRSVVWAYPDDQFTAPDTPIDFFCCGQAFLADGRLLAAGGTAQYDPFFGLRDAYLFDPATEQWSPVQQMAGGRWYPTLVTLGDGRILAVSGYDEHNNLNRIPEIYRPAGGWSTLPATRSWPLYAQLFLLADGGIFYSGGQYGTNNDVLPAILDLSTNTVVDVPGLDVDRNRRNQAASVLLPPAQQQRVLLAGGGPPDAHDMSPATASVYTVTLDVPNPVYQAATPLHIGRMHLNAVLLPDWTVVVCGGSRAQEMRAEAALEAELYDPATDTWTLGARARVARLYHSVALLLPDARVLSAGSNPDRKDEDLRLEIYHPPYLFKGPRPVIDAAPPALTYGQNVEVQTPQAAQVAKASLVAPGATTHSEDTSQRLISLDHTQLAADILRITGPATPDLAPPGWYMLFLVDTQGIPSTAHWIQLQP